MNTNDPKYTRFALCREMMETPEIIRNFNPESVSELAELCAGSQGLFFTGEGSSRLFPAKRAREAALRNSKAAVPLTEGATQSLEYNLEQYAVMGASNSGRTRELVRLFQALRKKGHRRLGGLTAHPDTPLGDTSDACVILNCGAEDAVAATKSVVEQAMMWQALCAAADGLPFPETAEGGNAFARALETEVPGEISQAMAGARVIYFAGRNDGVAEELTLKTNEIVRKSADFLEGTYAAHGIEEVMHKDDVVILVDPFEQEEAKLKECLENGVGVKIFAIADRQTSFPTIQVPASGDWKEYTLLAAGWNLLTEAGIKAGIDLDKPERARKVGNEV